MVKKYPVNTILFTKDGRKTGNAIVVGHDDRVVNLELNIVRTDYGHTSRMTNDEVASWFFSKNLRPATDSHKNFVFSGEIT